MKHFYLNIWEHSSYCILYCLESDSIKEKMLFELLDRGFCYLDQNDGKWFSVEFFNEPSMEIETTDPFSMSNSDDFFKNVKELKYIGSVDTRGYKNDGKPFFIAPVPLIIVTES